MGRTGRRSRQGTSAYLLCPLPLVFAQTCVISSQGHSVWLLCQQQSEARIPELHLVISDFRLRPQKAFHGTKPITANPNVYKKLKKKQMASYEFDAQSCLRKMVITEISLAPLKNRPIHKYLSSTEESTKSRSR